VYQVREVADDGTYKDTYIASASSYVGAGWTTHTNYYTKANLLIEQKGTGTDGDQWDHKWDNGYGNAGAYSYGYIDTANNDTYREARNYFDAANRFIKQTGTDDAGEQWEWTWVNGQGGGGTSRRIDWDTAGLKNWWHQIQDFNAAGA
jgi:hypothetical protein